MFVITENGSSIVDLSKFSKLTVEPFEDGTCEIRGLVISGGSFIVSLGTFDSVSLGQQILRSIAENAAIGNELFDIRKSYLKTGSKISL